MSNPLPIKYGVLKGTVAGHPRNADNDHYQVLVHAGKTVWSRLQRQVLSAEGAVDGPVL